MKVCISITFVTLIFLACTKKEYTNQNEYLLNIGETVDIYFSTNSCCQYCVLNSDELTAISFVDEITVEPYPDDCAGCNFTGAFVFKAIEAGTDTVLLNAREMSASCYDLTSEPEMYIVHVQ